MLSENKYFRDLTEAELWQRYCGFLDLSIDEFIDIQEELLMDQIDRVADSVLGKKIMGKRKPKSVEEFRRMVPLTTYDDYEPYLSEKRENVLAVKPHMWCHSAGTGGCFKWVPHSSEFLEQVTKRCLASLILATCRGRKGWVNFWPGSRFLLIIPPIPYASACMFQALAERFSFKAMPPQEAVQSKDFRERIRRGFQMALRDGVDIMGGIGSVIVRIGEEMGGQARGMKFSPAMLDPRIVARMLRALIRSKREKRGILPKDMWSPKAIMAGGVDTAIYRDDVEHYWGTKPYEFYICTEVFFLAVESWNRRGMVFVPDSAFLEFIPCGEQAGHHTREKRQVSTVLLDEVEEGKYYEVVITQFYGLPLLRYRMEDIVKVITLRDDETGIKLPYITVQGRVGETINIAGLAELDEKTVWQAIANTGVKYVDWVACKEYDQKQTSLRIYLELKEKKEAGKLATMIDKELKVIDTDYKDIKAYLKLQPVRVSLLSAGTFQRYTEEKAKEGADLAHLKPRHMNASEENIQRLLALSALGSEK